MQERNIQGFLQAIRARIDRMQSTEWVDCQKRFIVVLKPEWFFVLRSQGIKRTCKLWGYKIWFVEDAVVSDVHIFPKRFSPIPHKQIVRMQREARKRQ